MNPPIPIQVQRFVTTGSASARRIGGLVRSNRFTLSGALILCILVPEFFHSFAAESFVWARANDLDQPELLISILAIVLAHFGLQKLNGLPLVNDRMAILPAFLVSYAIVVALAGFIMRDFGRYHLVTSFVVGMAWYYFIAVTRSRLSFPKLAVVGDMAHHDELLLTRIEWVSVDGTRLPRDVLGIVFDKHQRLSPEYERLFVRAVLRRVPVYEISKLREMVTGRVQLHLRPEEEFGAIFPSQPYLRIKRFFDFVTAVPALVVAAPLIGLFALLIRLESPGPAIFRQERIGYQGRRFTCYKLRSMRSDIPGPLYTTEQDPRITTLGRFIRTTRIDELPQLFNILKGDMGWIGPRPEALKLARSYERDIPYYGYRHLVRPGITGWAAVHQGNVALVDAATRKLEYDFYYIKHFSPWLDFLIVLMTIRTILTGFGSR